MTTVKIFIVPTNENLLFRRNFHFFFSFQNFLDVDIFVGVGVTVDVGASVGAVNGWRVGSLAARIDLKNSKFPEKRLHWRRGR